MSTVQRSICALILAVMVNGAAAVSVHVVSQPTSGTTAAGYTPTLTYQPIRHCTYITLTDGVQVGWKDGSVASTYVRTDSTDALLMDAVTYGAGAVSTVLVKNLPAGRYSVTLYGYDTHYKDKVTHFDLDGNGDGTSDVSAVIDNRSGNQSSATVSLDVSADGVLAITGGT